MNFWKYTALGLLIALLVMIGCNKCQGDKIAKLKKDCDQKLVKSDTSRHDSIAYVHDTIPGYKPKPDSISYPVPVYIDTFDHTVRYHPVDTTAILRDYFASVFYRDNQKIHDSAGKEIGDVTIEDVISQNRIQNRKLLANIQKEIINYTVTNTIEAKNKNGWYIGLNANYFTWNKQISPSASLLFISKKDFGLEAGAGLFNDKLFYSGSFKLKLHK